MFLILRERRFGSLSAKVRRLLLGSIVAIAACGWAAGATAAPDLRQRFQAHINYLADDRLEGRGVGSQGIELAAEYIAKHFADVGLKPTGDGGTFFQTFPMTLHRTLTDTGRLGFEGDTIPLKQGDDFLPMSFSSNDAFSGKVTFCGYGIVAPEKQHDDFAGLDLSGRVALMLLGEPPSWADENGFTSRFSFLRDKIYNAKDRGAAAVLLVNPVPPAGDADALTEFDADNADEYGIPALHVTRSVIDARLAKIGAGPLAKSQERLDAGGPHAFASTALDNLSVSGQAGFQKNTLPTRNVLGLWAGTDASGEALVIGAHYDHLGKRKPMMRAFKEGKLVRDTVEPQIHNGADDNASGVAGLIEIARMVVAASRPRRGILFIAFSGEEAGLHGSKFYIAHPSMPLDKTVAMLNLDMIGRMPPDSNKLTVFGAHSAPEFMHALETAAREIGLVIGPSHDEGGRSDHAPFVRQKIPSMHFFSGHHADYHKPGDDSEKINAEAGAKVTILIARVALAIANREQRPTYQEVKPNSEDAPKTAGYRVVMGLSPGYVDDGQPGMLVEAVSPQGPAELGGMKSGDRIVRVGGKKVGNIYDYMAATRGNNPGDTVEVAVLRDGREVLLQVTLAGSR